MNPAVYSLAACALLSFAFPAHADRLPAPNGAPPSYQAECGSCHMAFPPALLTAPDWKQVMARLDQHYGGNATVDEKTRRELEAFLARNAASDRRMAGAGDPPRLTASAWFQRKHRKVSGTQWRDARVKSAANCAGCHPRADQGGFSEHDITLAGLREKKKSWFGDD
jgi:hypothetical protein